MVVATHKERWRLKPLMILVALIGLSACSSTEKLASCKGPVFALNTGHWVPSPADMQMAKPGKTE